ncbi:MAG: hypothetical protein KF734_17790 [Saprospiraceae bacterium]|nr:hypothetical protein [Saprospiraceae bacterium]
MKTTIIVLTLFATAFLWLACKQTKYTPGNFPDKQLRWGSGGGIVGKETTYTLLDNGQIFKREMGGSLTETSKAKANKAKALYKMVETLGLAQRDFKHPGNVYDFIEVLDGDSVHRISWGEANIPVDPKIKDLFNELNGLTKK